MVLIAGSERPHSGLGLILDSAPLQTLGKLSYSWYLWHWPFLVFSSALVPSITASGKIAAALVALVVAAITQRFIENPIRFNPGLMNRPTYTLCLAATITLLSFGAAFLSIRFAASLANTGELKTFTAAVDDIAALPREQCVSLGTSSDVKTCSFGNKSSSTVILLFGDSHAIQWFNPLQRLALSHNWKLITIVKSGCPATDIKLPHDIIGACGTWRQGAIRRIVELRPTVVVIGNANHYLQHKESTAGRLVVTVQPPT